MNLTNNYQQDMFGRHYIIETSDNLKEQKLIEDGLELHCVEHPISVIDPRMAQEIDDLEVHRPLLIRYGGVIWPEHIMHNKISIVDLYMAKYMSHMQVNFDSLLHIGLSENTFVHGGFLGLFAAYNMDVENVACVAPDYELLKVIVEAYKINAYEEVSLIIGNNSLAEEFLPSSNEVVDSTSLFELPTRQWIRNKQSVNWKRATLSHDGNLTSLNYNPDCFSETDIVVAAISAVPDEEGNGENIVHRLLDKVCDFDAPIYFAHASSASDWVDDACRHFGLQYETVYQNTVGKGVLMVTVIT